MSNLISGKEAFDAAYNGDEAQWRWTGRDVEWRELKGETAFSINSLKDSVCEFRLKPRTITLNGIEVPAPFEPKNGDDCRCYCINTSHKIGYDWYHCSHHSVGRIVWRSEEEVKQVVEALRSIFK